MVPVKMFDPFKAVMKAPLPMKTPEVTVDTVIELMTTFPTVNWPLIVALLTLNCAFWETPLFWMHPGQV